MIVTLRRFGTNPWVALIAIVLGVLAGLALPQTTAFFSFVSRLYLIVLEMCVVPILVSLVTLSIARLTGTSGAARFVARISCWFPLGMAAASVTGVAAGLLFGPGRALGPGVRRALGIAITSAGSTLEIPLLDAPLSTERPSTLIDLLSGIIPANVFDAIARGNSLQIIFAAILFGAALGTLEHRGKEAVLSFMEGVYGGFRVILDAALALLPLAAFARAASQAATLNWQSAQAMGAFLIGSDGLLFLTALGCAAVVAFRARASLGTVMARQKSLWVLALTSRNSFACLPLCIESLQRLGFDAETSDVVVPLAVSICRIGSIAYFGFAAIFVAQLYGVALDVPTVAVITFTSVLAGLATAGLSSIASLTVLGMVLAAIDTPFDAALVLFVAIDTLVDPFRTLLTVVGGVAVASAVEPHGKAPAT